MADGQEPEVESLSNKCSESGVHDSPRKALEKVGSEYEYWSGRLTDASLQMCYCLIGANWVVCGSVGGILNSTCAKLSLLMVLLTLGANVAVSWWASEEHRKIFEFAEGHGDEWKKQFEEAKGKRTPWPFTQSIEIVGRWLRRVKGAFPLISQLILLIGAILK